MNSRFSFITLIVLLFAQSVLAKDKEEPSKPLVTDTIIGYTLSKQPIMARQYAFDCNVSKFDIGADPNDMMLVLREKKKRSWGKMGQFNMSNEQFNWQKEIDMLSGKVKFAGDKVLHASFDFDNVFDRNNGNWLTRCSKNAFIEPKTGLAFESPAPQPEWNQKTFAINLNNGKSEWKHKMDVSKGVFDTAYLNDSIMVLVSATGIHQINLHTGKGWDIKANAYNYNSFALNDANVGGMILFGVVGWKLISSSMNIGPGICSKLLIADNLIYFADSRRILCIGMDGKLVWENHLDEDYTSISELFVHGDKICMFNKGYINTPKGPIKYGGPFVAGFSKTDGKQLFLDTMGIVSSMSSHEVHNDTITINTGRRLYQWNLLTGDQINSIPLAVNLEKYQSSVFVDGNKFFTEANDGNFNSMAQKYPGAYCIVTADDKLEIYSATLIKLQELELSKVWEYSHDYHSYKCIHNNKDKFVFLSNGQKVAELPIPESCVIRDGKIYGINNGRLQVTALPEVMN